MASMASWPGEPEGPPVRRRLRDTDPDGSRPRSQCQMEVVGPGQVVTVPVGSWVIVEVILHSKSDMRSPEHMTAAARFPPLDFHLYGHAFLRIFININNEKVSFRDFYRRVSSREHFKKRIVSMKGLREFRCSEGSENEGWSRGAWGGEGRPGPARTPIRPGPVFFLRNG